MSGLFPFLGGLRTENSAQMENLASHGYFVVGIDHEAAFASVDPNGQVLSSVRPPHRRLSQQGTSTNVTL